MFTKGFRTLSLLSMGALAAHSFAGYATGFEAGEGFTGSSGGTILAGQNLWYTPAVANSADFNCYTYAGNGLTMATNAAGGSQFAGFVGPGTLLGRAQRPLAFLSGAYVFEYDVCFKYNGAAGLGSNNAGSVSTQDSVTTKGFISLAVWDVAATPTGWTQQLNAYDSLGSPINNYNPFQVLSLDRWYHVALTVDFATNRVNEMKVYDLGSGATQGDQAERYLQGGSASALPLPTDFRLFVGGANAGNAGGYDNVAIGQPVNVDTLTVLQGEAFEGGASDLALSDNVRFSMFNDATNLQAEVEMSGTTSVSTPSGMRFEVEASVGRPGLAQEIYVYNFTSNAYQFMSGTTASSTDISAGRLYVSGSQFINSGGLLKSKVRWSPINDEDPSQDGWLHSLDVARWNVF
ncbi:MAG TPA: hypothetical protein PKA27_04970 [Fimbriimonadaceae bacterium]|nr:hypothetical protein [Fimbriimonadaceae bacterium]